MHIRRSIHYRWLTAIGKARFKSSKGRGSPTCIGRPIIEAAEGSEIRVDGSAVLVSNSVFTALGVMHPVILRTLLPGARIRIGANSGLSGTTICAARAVSIGQRVLIGADVIVADTDFHPTEVVPRNGAPIPVPKPEHEVIIHDDVFIGARSVILKGVEIGEGSVIGAGSVVTRSVPAHTLSAGNPARPIRKLSP